MGEAAGVGLEGATTSAPDGDEPRLVSTEFAADGVDEAAEFLVRVTTAPASGSPVPARTIEPSIDAGREACANSKVCRPRNATTAITSLLIWTSGNWLKI
jgi:hypothetical protein